MSIPKRVFLRANAEKLLISCEEFAGRRPPSFEKEQDTVLARRLHLIPSRCSEMNSDQVEGKWKQFKGSVKKRWGKLTDDDLTMLSGKKDELIGKLQERYGYTREQAEREADDWATKSSHEWADAAAANRAGKV
jgi:uncharacterized protein YjbJ (UPF0337 family)